MSKVRSTFKERRRALHLAALRLRTQRFAQRLGQGPLECAGAFRRAKPPRRSVSPEVTLRRSAPRAQPNRTLSARTAAHAKGGAGALSKGRSPFKEQDVEAKPKA